MKKKILMIGNTDGLSGVPVDIASYYSFFTNPIGGNWCREEIDVMLNPSQRCAFNKIVEIEEAAYDYVITIFAGHGNEADDDIVLIINEQEDTILMSDLTNLSQKQLIILDCCREPIQMAVDFAFIETRATMLSMSQDPIRRAYEDRILHCPPQEIILFSCDQGEMAKDTASYSSHLLHAVEMVLADSHSPFVSVNRAHERAVSLLEANRFYTQQHPQIQQSRCLINRRLPFAVNTKLWGIYD